jgi:hypothetical protein
MLLRSLAAAFCSAECCCTHLPCEQASGAFAGPGKSAFNFLILSYRYQAHAKGRMAGLARRMPKAHPSPRVRPISPVAARDSVRGARRRSVFSRKPRRRRENNRTTLVFGQICPCRTYPSLLDARGTMTGHQRRRRSGVARQHRDLAGGHRDYASPAARCKLVLPIGVPSPALLVPPAHESVLAADLARAHTITSVRIWQCAQNRCPMQDVRAHAFLCVRPGRQSQSCPSV